MAQILNLAKQHNLNMKNIHRNLSKSFTFHLILVVLAVVMQISCKKEELPAKEITYTLSGNFDKNVMVNYTPTGGTIANGQELVTLPWQKNVNPNLENGSVGLMVIGEGGLPRTEITAKIFVNGQEQQSITSIADKNGHIAININHLFD